MKLRKFFLVLLVFFFITPVSLAGAKTSFQGVGLGSPLSAWKTAWGSASHASTYCQDATACWGPPTINNTTGATFLFTTVFFEKGVTTGFTINLANNSPYANALHALKYTMPSDATYGKLIPTNSGYGSACALMYGKSVTLGKELQKAGFKKGQTSFTAEFLGTSSDQTQTYFHSTDVQQVIVSTGGYSSGC